MNLNTIAAPLLRARGIQLAHIDCVWTEDHGTVYTITEETGKIGTFSIPTQELAAAVESKSVPALLTPYFQHVEFTDGTESIVSPVQQVSDGPETSGGSTEPDQEIVDEEHPSSETTSPARGTESEGVTEGPESAA